jgi:hypothetical protein
MNPTSQHTPEDLHLKIIHTKKVNTNAQTARSLLLKRETDFIAVRNFIIFFCLSVIFSSCGNWGSIKDTDKIKFELKEFTDDGLRKLPGGEFSSINYEFCVPATDEMFAKVKKIDTTLTLHKLSKGRSRCTSTEWLCIGYSNQPGFKNVITKLASLGFIREINETFWE